MILVRLYASLEYALFASGLVVFYWWKTEQWPFDHCACTVAKYRLYGENFCFLQQGPLIYSGLRNIFLLSSLDFCLYIVEFFV